MRLLLAVLMAAVIVGCQVQEMPDETERRVPAWAQDQVVYQIFPERFANGDTTNDPTRQTLERPVSDVPESWRGMRWTRDWYERAAWEKRQSDDFYESVYDRRYGGDLQGVIDRLPYLDSLGVTTLYVNPVFWANSLHKYDANTFHHVDPHFGPDPEGDKALIAQETPTDPATWTTTAADSLFFDLLDRAHDRGLRVVIDGVFNHTGRDFFAFRDLAEKQQDSKYAGWYDVESYDDPSTPDTSEFEYAGWWDIDALPEFANSPDGTNLAAGPKQYVFDATRRWMDPNGDGDPSDGVDGWRLDVAEEVPVGFWATWHRHVRAINPEAYTVAEVWEDAAVFLEKGGFSSTMNYFGFAYPVKGFLMDDHLAPSDFADVLEARRTAYDPVRQRALLNLVDSHDTPRLATMVVNRADTGYVEPDRYDYDWGAVTSLRQNRSYKVRAPTAEERDLQRLVALFQLTYPGMPMIYYGTAAGMWGADDPDDRKPMVWPDSTYDVEDAHPFGRERPADPVRFRHDLFQTYQTLITLRTSSPTLRRGDFGVVQADDERRLLTYARTPTGSDRGERTYVVTLNRSADAHSARIPLPDSLRGTYEIAFQTPADGSVRLQQDATALLLDLPPHSGVVLRQ
jgi:glycosidase